MVHPIQRYTIGNLLLLTAVSAVLMSVFRLLGPRLAFAVLAVTYGFAPTIAVLTIFLTRGSRPIQRGMAAALTLLLLAGLMLSCSIWFYGNEATKFVLLGTLIEWPGQLAVIGCLKLLLNPSPSSTSSAEPSSDESENEVTRDDDLFGGQVVLLPVTNSR
jgi:hypothetical protein